MYYIIKIVFDDDQLNRFLDGFEKSSSISLDFYPDQLDHQGGMTILVTEPQLEEIIDAIETGSLVRIKFSSEQMDEMKHGIMSGSGIFDSIGNFFKSAKNWVSNKFKDKTPAIGKMSSNVYSRKNTVETVPKVIDHGQKYDNQLPSFRPPVMTNFDKFANKIGDFDKKIDKFFSY